MDCSISALTYKGSIPEAILEAKKQKKLLVVYISGAESAELEKLTWTDPKVTESLSKYCILLHLSEGSSDAANFSAIYPQKSAPSIAAIGYNGVQLWQSEGFVSAEVLASSLEKAWLSLHIQETTATVLTAALTSKKSEPSASGSSDIGSLGQGSSSCTIAVPSCLMDNHVQSSQARPLAASEMVEENNSLEHPVEDKRKKLDENTFSKSLDSNNSQSVGDERSRSPGKAAERVCSSLTIDPGTSIGDRVSSDSGVEDGYGPQDKITDHRSGFLGGDSHLVIANKAVREEKAKWVDDGKANILDTNTRVNALSDVHLNIRLLNGVSLQEKFSVTSMLRMVKDYVDKNQASGLGSYNLAIPYPYKVFSDQDLSKSLSDLGLFNRQALMVVPRQRGTSYYRGSSSDQTTATADTNASNTNDGGYFAYVKRILSYVNPLSYLGGNAASTGSGQAQTGLWEYGPNPALQNNLARTGRPNQPSATGTNDSKSKQPTTTRYGNNIHTLKHDEDDGRFGDRNAFWNGNSTQYGGDNDGK